MKNNLTVDKFPVKYEIIDRGFCIDHAEFHSIK